MTDPAASTRPHAATAAVFPGDSEMARRCRGFDWAATPLGPVATWPEALRAVVALVLGAPVGMILLWGPQLVQVYNDEYREVMGDKHPGGLGRGNRECWPEVWDFTGPLYEAVLGRGVAFRFEDQRLVLERGGPPAEAFFTLTYSPVPGPLPSLVPGGPTRDDAGRALGPAAAEGPAVGGVLVTVVETTARVRAREACEAARRASDAKYRALFDSLDAAFCVLEVLFEDPADGADPGRPVDYRFLEVNRAFVRQTGLADPVGRTGRELVPGLEPHWAETYGRVVRTGEPVRFENAAEGLGRWFDVSAVRVGGPEERRVAVLFTDVSAARAAERERARLLAALEVERARLAEVFRQAPAFLAVLRGPEHVVERVNDAYYQLVGHRDIVGLPVLDALPEVRGQGFQELLDDVLATGVPWTGREVPVRLARTPGAPAEKRFVDLTYLPLVESDIAGDMAGDGAGGATRTGVIAHGTDVTAQVRARREVERLLAESEAARARAEQARAEAEEARTAAEAARAALALSEARQRFLLALDDRLRPLADPDAIRAEAARTLGEHLGAARVGYAVDQGDGATALVAHTYVHAVPRVEGAYPYSAFGATLLDELRAGRSVARADVARDPAFTDEEKAAHAAIGIGAAFNVPLVKDGRLVAVLFAHHREAHAWSAAEAALLEAVAGRTWDAVERARAEAARERMLAASDAARAEAEAANRAKGEFLAVMSHELRTPLNAIGGYAQLLALGITGPVSDAQRVQLERIQQSQRHLLGLVNEVLDLSKIDAGAVAVARDAVAVGGAVDAALALVRPQAAAKRLALGEACDVPAEGPAAVRYLGDEPRVRQILVNLLANAVKFTPDGGRVTIACALGEALPGSGADGRDGGPYVALRVADTGVGIAPDQQERIFEPFTQAAAGNSPYTRTVGGTGLGLTISRRLARLMGGDLTLESTPGAGSTFTLWLPMAERRARPRR